MDTQKLISFLCIFFLFSLVSENRGVDGSDRHYHHRETNGHLFDFRPTKLFVFGDSYADTGNIRKSLSSSWKFPYGITFPGKPAGRFSDGRVSTDFLAKFLGVKSPIPYIWRSLGGKKYLKHGMNFAYGGTGVFDTLVPMPNMTTQIHFFQQLVHDRVFNPDDLRYSIALVSVAGNDYSTYLATNGSIQGFQGFITKVIGQLTVNLKQLHSLGVKRIAVPTLQPLGCIPRSTAPSSFQKCNGTENLLVNFHNALLQQAVEKLNNETKESTFVILDLYNAFLTVFKNNGKHPGSTKFENPLKPCCVGVSSQYSCGSVDETGARKYTVCEDPKSTFFWDTVHPSQEGWRAVFSVLRTNLKQLQNSF